MGDVKHIYTIPDGELLDSQWYVVTIEHVLTDDPDPKSWYTSYDVRNDTTEFLSSDQCEAIAEYLAGVVEGPLAYSNTKFVGAVVRPWQRMTPEEEALYMVSVPLGTFGQIDETAVIEVEMDRVLVISRRPDSGKRGRLSLRNSLTVANLEEADHLVSLDPSFVADEVVNDVLDALDNFDDVMDMVVLSMIGRVQTEPTIKHAAAEGETQEWEHIMSGPICRVIKEHNLVGLGKRQVHNS